MLSHEHVGQPFQAPLQQLHLTVAGTLLRGEHRRGIKKHRAHIARHHDVDAAQSLQGVQGPLGTESPIGGGRSTHPHQDPAGPGVNGSGHQLPGAKRGCGQRIVGLGSRHLPGCQQGQTRCLGHFHNSGGAHQSPPGLNLVAQGSGHHRGAVGTTKYVKESLATIGHGDAVAGPTHISHRHGHGIGNLGCRCGSAELVRGGQYMHHPCLAGGQLLRCSGRHVRLVGRVQW